MNDQECACGSGETRDPLYDGHGIFLTYACSSCEEVKLARFRPDILDRYDAEEPIEPEGSKS